MKSTPVQFRDFGYGSFDVDRPIGPAAFGHFDLLWIHQGSVSIRFMNQPAQTIEGGEGVLIFPNTPFVGHAISTVARASIAHFALAAPAARSPLPLPLAGLIGRQHGYEHYRMHGDTAFETLIDQAMQLAHGQQDATVMDMRLAILTVILGALERARQRQPRLGPHADRLDVLLRRLAKHPDKPASLDDMAAFMKLSTSHFRAMFRRRVGVSPGKYLQERRMGEAARLLRETDLSIKGIAQRLGFEELPHFYRQFKAVHGRTPRQYRQRHTPSA